MKKVKPYLVMAAIFLVYSIVSAFLIGLWSSIIWGAYINSQDTMLVRILSYLPVVLLIMFILLVVFCYRYGKRHVENWGLLHGGIVLIIGMVCMTIMWVLLL